MGPPRHHHIVLFTLGMICMLLSLSLFLFVLYIAPYVMFDFVYNVPEFVVQMAEWYQTSQAASGFSLIMLIFMPFITASIVFALLSRRLTRRLEHIELDPTLEPDQLEEELERPAFNFRGAFGPAASEIALVVAVIALLFLVEYFIIMDVIE